MELKLNIYKGREIEKTYSTQDVFLMTGTCEDILKIVDVDRLMGGSLSDEQMGIEIIKIVTKSFRVFYPFVQEVFEGLTEEELRRTRIDELAKCVLAIVQYAVTELFNVGGNDRKN